MPPKSSPGPESGGGGVVAGPFFDRGRKASARGTDGAPLQQPAGDPRPLALGSSWLSSPASGDGGRVRPAGSVFSRTRGPRSLQRAPMTMMTFSAGAQGCAPVADLGRAARRSLRSGPPDPRSGGGRAGRPGDLREYGHLAMHRSRSRRGCAPRVRSVRAGHGAHGRRVAGRRGRPTRRPAQQVCVGRRRSPRCVGRSVREFFFLGGLAVFFRGVAAPWRSWPRWQLSPVRSWSATAARRPRASPFPFPPASCGGPSARSASVLPRP